VAARVLVATTALVVGAGSLPAPGRAAPAAQARPSIELAGQSAVAVAGRSFDVQVRLDGIPADGSLVLVLHQRVRSRSELAATMDGELLGREITRLVAPIAALAPDADGLRTLSLSLDPGAGGLPLPPEGVYPVAVRAVDAAGAEQAALVTHLIAPPSATDESPPLAVAVVGHLGAPPALQPDGTTALAAADVERLAATAAALNDAAGVPATLAVSPETVDALAASGEPEHVELLDDLRAAVVDRSVLRTPYVEVAADQLARVDLLDELRLQLEAGDAVLTQELGVTPAADGWLAAPDLAGPGLQALAAVGVRTVVVDDAQVEPLDPGLLSFSLAQPFALAPPDDDQPGRPEPSGVTALAVDPVVEERLAADGSPALVVSRVLSELAMVRLERPGIARALVVPIDDDLDPATTTLLLEALDAGAPFAPTTLAGAVEATEPVQDLAGNVAERALVPTPGEDPISAREAAGLRAARRHLGTFDGLLGGGSPRVADLGRHLLLASATELDPDEREAQVEAVEAAIDEVADAVAAPERATVTLTARDGTIPLSLRNDAGVPLDVVVRLESAKLEFPDGEVRTLTLTEETTRLDLAVRARASGSFPLDVEITTPDGARQLATTRYTVQSTAISGVGLVLSVGAGLFLVAWWASHWRRTRRSAKLVTTGHPAAQPRHLSDG
jgi:hypothetical protein